jgi:4-hydroxy-3-polyprenylbenzoate decarboxylase
LGAKVNPSLTDPKNESASKELPRRLVVGISGASGAILGIRLLEILRPLEIETHLVLSPAARVTIAQETGRAISEVQALADVNYNPADIGASIASGSFETMGMVIIPCSIKTLSAVANSYAEDLLSRAADVSLKEGRPLVLVVREAPLHSGHIRLMSLAAESGAIIFPPVPAFYTHPQNLDDIVTNIAGRVLARVGVMNEWYARWREE